MASIRCTEASKNQFDKYLKQQKQEAKKKGKATPTQESLFAEILEAQLKQSKK